MFLSNRGSFRPETSGAYTLRRRGRRRPKSGSAIGACAVARLAGSGGPIGDYYGSANKGFKEPRGKALDQFILMRTIPACVPSVPDRTLKCGYEPWSYDVDDLLGFVSFMDVVLMPAGYELSEEDRDLMDHLHGIFAAEDEDEIFGEGDAEADAPEADDEPPFDVDEDDADDPALAKAA